jgi:DmsE family decaheme c-type cytochrome
MTTLPTPLNGPPLKSSHQFIGILMVLLLAIVLISCATVDKLAVAPPQIPGAIFVGSESCDSCHDDQAKAFNNSVHSKFDSKGGKAVNCETCHGPASIHVNNPEKGNILNPATIHGEAASSSCASCHSNDKIQTHWKGSVHSKNEGGCASCHQIHGGKERLLKGKSESDTCFKCHSDVRADMLKRSKHPVHNSSESNQEGKMSCSSCHNPHGAKGQKLMDAHSINDKCYECHTEKKAPMLWEHSPVKEDCLTCHSAHGSTNDKMLVTKVPRLCQECHMQGRHQSGTLAENSTFLLNRGCLNCHAMVHGSNSPSGAVLQR